MSIFQTMNVPNQFGVTRISQVTDEEIWRHLVTPTVKGLLGSISKPGTTRVMDTVAGLFPGDEATNLNGHMFKDASGNLSAAYVRYPYYHTIYRTTNGAMVIKRDGVKFEVFCWFGDVDKGKGELIFKAALRDRLYDGTKRANDCALLEFAYDNPVYHKRISTTLSSVELSIYGYMPGSRIADATGDTTFDRFVSNPFRFIDQPQVFLELFQLAFQSKRGPGQYSAAIPDVAKYALPGFERLAAKYGYDLIEMAASHYHVAKWGQAAGYSYSDLTQAAMVAKLHAGLEAIRARGIPLTRSQQSWVCVLQSLRPVELIPETLRIGSVDGGAELLSWPQNNVDDQCLWLYKPVSARAQGFVPDVSFTP